MSMTQSTTIYWDSCVYISWLDNKRDQQKDKAIRFYLDLFREGKINILASVLVWSEVLSAKHEQKSLDMFNGLPNERNFCLASMDMSVATEVSELRNYLLQKGKKMNTPDAIHLVTANIYGAKEFHTFDTRLIKLNGILPNFSTTIIDPRGARSDTLV